MAVVLVGLAFLNPLLLSGIALAALPIVIHLLSRRQFRRVPWAATRFLLEAEKENRRRVRFEQWLLVALRCLALALLALVMARPYVQPGMVASLIGGRGVVQRVILLDDSASLGFRGGAAADFAVLRDALERLLEWLRQEAAQDPVAVYLASAPQKPIVELRHASEAAFEDWRSRLSRVRLSDARAHPVRMMEKLAAELEAVAGRARMDLYILSDFQKTDWLSAGGQSQSPFEPLKKYADSVRAVLIASGSALRDNASLTELRVERPQIIAGVPTFLLATASNFGRQTLREASLTLEIDGAAQPPVLVEGIDPGKSRTVSVELTLADAGMREVSATLSTGDGLPLDDVRRIAVNVKPDLALLLVNGEPSSEPAKDEIALLRNALAPPGPFSSGIRIETADVLELENANLERFDCVALCNVPPPSEAASAALLRFVMKGGGLVTFLGAQVADGVDYNRTLYANGNGVLPCELEPGSPPQTISDGVGLIRSAEHPITAAFPAGAEGLSEYVRFRTYYRVIEPKTVRPDAGAATTQSSTVASVLARFKDPGASAALIERGVGRGRSLLFTSSVDLDWNDWARAADGSYVVTLLEMMHYAARRSDERPALTVGEPVALAVSQEIYEPLATVRTPAYPEEPVTTASFAAGNPDNGSSDRLVGPVAARAGTYRFELKKRAGGDELRPVCVNIDPAESDLASALPVELSAALGPIANEYVAAREAFGGASEPSRRELWSAVLLGVFALLLLEQMLAWHFGRPLGGAAPGRTRFVTASAPGAHR